ncbi:damage-control phosphatase [Archaeoglobus veneficus]|uniref:Damage-control phosphatase ARMT1-like metal-binding domain-containing protein n=1 Tax=Archaeoglobus veneficus (strain DSM 11195 / SNP6) TaxID=693661 RepID=F2KPG8_ARCVS|nr:damage-control phosphatase [Archaeoglobus veneficus]AEA46399.1 protein of unknown function DUF89 [Archaeoglobus veneficus SNP6]
MKISPRCPACLLNRVYLESSMATSDEDKIHRAVEESLKILAKRYPDRDINAVIATEMHRKVYEILGVEDPYKKLKDKANEVALRFLPAIRDFVEKQDDRFRSAAIAAIIGNTFDYGVMGHEVAEDDFMDYFMKQYSKGLAIDDTADIMELCSGKVVYLTDNAGEIVVDTILMKEIRQLCERLTVVVRGKPILSDATLSDAKLAGVDRIADEVLTNGEGAIGIIEEELPAETLERLESADVIIAKGMANYECLSESRFKPIAFMLTAKCEPVARDIGVEVEDMVAMVRW